MYTRPAPTSGIPQRVIDIGAHQPWRTFTFVNRIVAELEQGVKPWVRPWDPDRAGGSQAPFNSVTDKRYHGVNVLILAPTEGSLLPAWRMNGNTNSAVWMED